MEVNSIFEPLGSKQEKVCDIILEAIPVWSLLLEFVQTSYTYTANIVLRSFIV